LNYYRSVQRPVQRPRKSYHVNLPAAIVSIMEFVKGEVVDVSIANDRGTKIVTIRKLQKAEEAHEQINVVT
jgi:antitoxin component of MazEF toxin-antitoxin module